MLPQGVRCAATPRATIEPMFALTPIHPTISAATWKGRLRNARYANDSTIAAM